MKEKFDTFVAFKKLCVKFKNEKNCMIGEIMRIQMIMAGNLRIPFMLNFVINMASHMSFLLLRHPNKMGFMKERIGSCRKWQG